MVYKKIQDKLGDYKDKKNVRFAVLEAHEAHTPQGVNVGWDEYENMEYALEAYNLIFSPVKE